jgi:hypothetical protein
MVQSLRKVIPNRTRTQKTKRHSVHSGQYAINDGKDKKGMAFDQVLFLPVNKITVAGVCLRIPICDLERVDKKVVFKLNI